MTDVKISDLILHSVEQKPVDFKDTFSSLLQDRLVSAIDDKRMEIAKTLFNPAAEIEDTEETEVEDIYDDQEQELEPGSEEEYNG